MTSSPDLVKLGGVQLRGVLGVLFVLILGPMIARWVGGDFSRFAGELVTLGLTAGVFFNFLRGARWARNLTVWLAMLGGMIAAFLGILISGGSTVGFFVFGAGLAFIACGFAIIGLPAVGAYFEHAHRGQVGATGAGR
ncbi:hypothetical protein [Deinococcus yavapaiensis]|uniref:Uncharacterized protein n=1 Tax=Deinococcus yavapaiensis KR-236 TaxID=694435 RepID=A0A318SAR8_9DEIO|nr:hypothetical protein [Deinococcus yavapaiensis]PYE53341.1 hypothetical protein DES52_109115 [Deinococcus yavapaiensis KR-236]